MGVSGVLDSSLELRSKATKSIKKKKVTSLKPTLRKRKVHFTDVHVIEYDSPSKKQDKADLWWTKDERKEILQNNQRLAKQFKAHHPHEIANANKAYDQCCYSSDSSSSSSESEDENTPTWLSTTTTTKTHHKPKLHLPTHVRGLEWAIFPTTKKHRKVHVQQVVEAQDEEDMAELANSSSKACVAFARLLAQCDEPSAAPFFLKRPRPRMWW